MVELKNYQLVMLSLVIFIVSSDKINAQKLAGEPVPGAEIFIELDVDPDEPIANVTTNEDGEFSIFTSTGQAYSSLPSIGTFIFTITIPRKFASLHHLDLRKKEKVKIAFNKKTNGPLFKYVLLWIKPGKAQNKGTFAVSGKSDA